MNVRRLAWLVPFLIACGVPSTRPDEPSGEGAPCGLGDPRTTAPCADGLSCCGGPTSPNLSDENGYAGWCARVCPEIPLAAGGSGSP
jgi:hypothetical protein